MRWFLSVATVLECALVCCAQEVDLATAKAKAALALINLKRDALPAADAKVKAAAGFKKCKDDRDFDCLSDLGAAIKRADDGKKPLFILVGMACHDAPEIRKGFPDAVWVHVGDSFNGNSTPRLLVRPAGSTTGIPFPRSEFGPGTPAEIRKVLYPTPGSRAAEADRWPPRAEFSRHGHSSPDC